MRLHNILKVSNASMVASKIGGVWAAYFFTIL